MRKIPVIMFLAACFFTAGASAVPAQEAKNTLTNAGVAAMIRAGLPEATIILAIQESDPDFDTSPKALIELHQIGATPKILNALLQTRSGGSRTDNKNRATPTPEPPDLECIEGVMSKEVVLIAGEERILMKRSQTQKRYSGMVLFGLGTSKSFIDLDGLRSLFRISDRTPEFETSLPADVNAAEKLVLVKLTPKSKRREVEVGRYSTSTSRAGFRREAIVPTTFEPIRTYSVAGGAKYTLYRIKVVGPLPPGEYALVPRNIYVDYYDFGIDPRL